MAFLESDLTTCASLLGALERKCFSTLYSNSLNLKKTPPRSSFNDVQHQLNEMMSEKNGENYNLSENGKKQPNNVYLADIRTSRYLV